MLSFIYNFPKYSIIDSSFVGVNEVTIISTENGIYWWGSNSGDGSLHLFLTNSILQRR